MKTKVTDERLLKAFETGNYSDVIILRSYKGAHYHLIHSAALVASGIAVAPPHTKYVCGMFLAGITLFSGCLRLSQRFK
jgi:uncharacterized membrane protein YgdD (TMEM256/DUF423 family)